MEAQLSQFILDKSFPCLMAKSVIKNGLIKIIKIKDAQNDVTKVLQELYAFVDDYRSHPKKLRSFVLVLDDENVEDFNKFEETFWDFLFRLNVADKKNFKHDPRVSSDPLSHEFSFSLKEEAFFILALHPKSPRFARRFFKPTIVFNLHQQFEDMRNKGIFGKVRSMIRKKDELLQGSKNPMLADFGEKSEIFQYIGKVYDSIHDPFLEKGFLHASH